MSDRMTGKSVIITGAAKGIGRGVAEVFAEEGADVVIADVDLDEAEAAAAAIRDGGGAAVAAHVDVTDPDSLEACVSDTVERTGGLDVLIHNAGIYPDVRLVDMSVEDWDQVHGVNLRGTFLAVKAVLPTMLEQGRGRIVITSSITGPRVGNPGLAHYSASKAGVNGFVKTAAIELARSGITINTVEPGNIMTPGMTDVLGADYIRDQERSIPMGKLGTPEDIAYAMLYLASDEAGYVTGQSIVVDGGQILPESLVDVS
jgi:3-oxoacyl-[acyl-carrier protein] reductase